MYFYNMFCVNVQDPCSQEEITAPIASGSIRCCLMAFADSILHNGFRIAHDSARHPLVDL